MIKVWIPDLRTHRLFPDGTTGFQVAIMDATTAEVISGRAQVRNFTYRIQREDGGRLVAIPDENMKYENADRRYDRGSFHLVLNAMNEISKTGPRRN